MRSRDVFVFASVGIILVSTNVAQAQHCSKPITHQNFISAVIKGKRRQKAAADYIKLIKSEGVDFALTSHDMQTLRRRGSYLGQNGLNDLQKAVRKNRCKATCNTPSINQAITNSPITNSPGSVQAVGSTVTINQAAPNRHLTPDQRKEFIRVIRQFPVGRLKLACPFGNDEACTFMWEVISALAEAGWDIPLADSSQDVITPPLYGIHLTQEYGG